MRLQLHEVSVELAQAKAQKILSKVSVGFNSGEINAVVGPSGCGKTTLIKAIAGIVHGNESGSIFWKGCDLNSKDFEPGECGYVPQHSNFHEQLTSREILLFSRKLKAKDASEKATEAFVDRLLAEVGLAEIAHQTAQTLSGGQRRRLSLGIVLCSEPSILLCDEVTSGLDPRSEREILELLKKQAHDQRRLVILVTHGQRDYEKFDTLTVLSEGRVAFHGIPERAKEFFGIENLVDVSELLTERDSETWPDRFLNEFGIKTNLQNSHHSQSDYTEDGHDDLGNVAGEFGHERNGSKVGRVRFLEQFWLVLTRRLICFFRNRSEIWIHVMLIVSFPAIVAVFAWNGLPKIQSLGFGIERNVSIRFEELVDFLESSSEVGGLVSGVVMFQVILLCIMGSNNSGREIAKERQIYELERLGGLRAGPYLLSKIVFLLLLCLIQSIWMGIFVHFLCQFPGDLFLKLGALFLVNVALSMICLGVSSIARSPETASLISVYIVGFQIPLSGAVLALPEMIGPLVRPFISSYWSWSGVVRTLETEQYYDIVAAVAPSSIAESGISFFVLLVHVILGIMLTWVGCRRRAISALR